MKETFHQLLDKAVRFHGHLCGGQVLGVRMAMAGLREIGIAEPRSEEGRDLIIFIEIDRCAADAIISVTGRTPGRRSIKLMDYGKMAATFVDSKTGSAVRVSADPDSTRKVDELAHSLFLEKNEKEANIAALMHIAEPDLLKIKKVAVYLKPEDLPGRPLASVTCATCGETVKDRREVETGGKILCRSCASGIDYYRPQDGSPGIIGRAGDDGRRSSGRQGTATDWNEVWKKVQAEKHAPMRDTKFWDKRAPEFARHASTSDYIGQFIAIMQPEPHWSVLDIGCAAGTLAIPLSPSVSNITALDASQVMLSLLEERCGQEGANNIRTVNGRWEDDWDGLGIGSHDVVVASRSLILDDLKQAVLKLIRYATKRVYISTLVEDGPHDRAIIEAVGRRCNHGADYIVVYNLLRDLGIYANVAFTINREEKLFTDLDDAVNGIRWMIHDMTVDEEKLLRQHLLTTLVKENGHWKLPYQRTVRWAVLWWDVEDQTAPLQPHSLQVPRRSYEQNA